MDVKDLNKSQLILLALLLSFVTSLATGITTVTLMQQAPASVRTPITRVVRQTVEKIVPGPASPALSKEEKELLGQLKSMQYLSASVMLEDKLLATGFFLGSDTVIANSVLPPFEEGQTYTIKSLLGERKIISMKSGETYTVIELEKEESEEETSDL